MLIIVCGISWNLTSSWFHEPAYLGTMHLNHVSAVWDNQIVPRTDISCYVIRGNNTPEVLCTHRLDTLDTSGGVNVTLSFHEPACALMLPSHSMEKKRQFLTDWHLFDNLGKQTNKQKQRQNPKIEVKWCNSNFSVVKKTNE